MITSSLEEYLKTIYILKKQKGEIRVTDIAEKMNCTKPSVNKAIKNLKAEGLINYEVYGSIDLTNSGEKLAKKIIEAYDIVYIFLTEVLEIKKEKAEKEAKSIKSSVDDETLNKLVKYVHKVLDLDNLDCDYDINKERCINCVRRSSAKEKIKNS